MEMNGMPQTTLTTVLVNVLYKLEAVNFGKRCSFRSDQIGKAVINVYYRLPAMVSRNSFTQH